MTSYYYQYPSSAAASGSGSETGGSPPNSSFYAPYTPASAVAAAAAAAANNAAAYVSRPASVSPPAGKAFPLSYAGAAGSGGAQSSPSSPSSVAVSSGHPSCRARFEASRGFDPQDDLEFCPALLKHAPTSSGAEIFHNHHHRQFAGSLSPTSLHPATSSTNNSNGSTSVAAATPSRVRRGIEIVDPTTGLKVASSGASTAASSPSLKAAGLARA